MSELVDKLMLRPGVSENDKEWLEDLRNDCEIDLKNYLGYEEDDVIPNMLIPLLKDMVLSRYNKEGTQGIASESHSNGGSTNYIDGLSESQKQLIRKVRRLKR